MKNENVHNVVSKRYLSASEVQKIFGISENTLANWRHEKKGPRYYKIGGMVRYNYKEFEQWVRKQGIPLDF